MSDAAILTRQQRRAQQREDRKAELAASRVRRNGWGGAPGGFWPATRASERRLNVREIAEGFWESAAGCGSIGAALARSPRPYLPAIAAALHQTGAASEVLREVLTCAQHMASVELRSFLRTPARFVGLFRAAGFAPPAELPEAFPVWRGARGLSVAEAVAGVSWTTRRDVACMYAMQMEARGFAGDPVVVRRMVRREDLVWFSDLCGEAECILASSPEGELDGTPEDWREAAARQRLGNLVMVRDALARWERDSFAYVSEADADPLWKRFLWRDFFDGHKKACRLLGLDLMDPGAAPAPQGLEAVTPELVRHVFDRCAVPLAGPHGWAHFLRVAENGAALAARTPGVDGALVGLFALLHDCRRRGDGDDPGHAERAADFARQLAGEGVLALPPERLGVLLAALRDHEKGRISSDPTVGVCWDADRLELARLGRRPLARLLSTDAAQAPDLQAVAWERGEKRTVTYSVARAWGLHAHTLEQAERDWQEPDNER